MKFFKKLFRKKPDYKNCPAWAHFWHDDQRNMDFVVFDPDDIYPKIIERGKLTLDQYGVEVARRCAIAKLKETIGPGVNIKIKKNDKYKLDSLPIGLGPARGAVEFRKYYSL